MYNFDPYTVFLAIATNIPQRLTAFVLQGHILHSQTVSDIYNIENFNCLTVYFSIVSLTYYYDFY